MAGQLTYGWAHYEMDNYAGPYATEDAAVDAAIGEYFKEHHRIPESVWVAELVNPRRELDANLFGSWACEYLTERLEEEVGEVAEHFTVTNDQEGQLGTVILDWIEKNIEGGFNCWLATNAREVKRPPTQKE